MHFLCVWFILFICSCDKTIYVWKKLSIKNTLWGHICAVFLGYGRWKWSKSVLWVVGRWWRIWIQKTSFKCCQKTSHHGFWSSSVAAKCSPTVEQSQRCSELIMIGIVLPNFCVNIYLWSSRLFSSLFLFAINLLHGCLLYPCLHGLDGSPISAGFTTLLQGSNSRLARYSALNLSKHSSNPSSSHHCAFSLTFRIWISVLCEASLWPDALPDANFCELLNTRGLQNARAD